MNKINPQTTLPENYNDGWKVKIVSILVALAIFLAIAAPFWMAATGFFIARSQGIPWPFGAIGGLALGGIIAWRTNQAANNAR